MSSSFDDKKPSRVLDHLYIGSRAHAKNRGLLKELGINRVLNVTPPRTMDPSNGVPNFFEKDRSMTYKRVAVFDNRGEDLLQHLDSCISFIEQGSFYGKVLVHCNKGVSRSSTVVAAYLMSTRGLGKDEAMTYLRAQRRIVNPHEGFMSQLEAFDVRLQRERAAAIADGQEKKYPNDLLETESTRRRAQGPSIGPARGPPGPAPTTKAARVSPTRGPVRGPSIGPSPPRPGKGRRGASAPPSPPRSLTNAVGTGAKVDGVGGVQKKDAESWTTAAVKGSPIREDFDSHGASSVALPAVPPPIDPPASVGPPTIIGPPVSGLQAGASSVGVTSLGSSIGPSIGPSNGPTVAQSVEPSGRPAVLKDGGVAHDETVVRETGNISPTAERNGHASEIPANVTGVSADVDRGGGGVRGAEGHDESRKRVREEVKGGNVDGDNAEDSVTSSSGGQKARLTEGP